MSLKECGKIFAHRSMKIHAYKSHTSSFLKTKFSDGALLKWILDPETMILNDFKTLGQLI